MFNRNAKYYQWLPAYLEGGLDKARQAQMQAQLAADPTLAAEAERLRRMQASLREAASREQAPPNSAVPADFWPRLQHRLEPASAPRPVRQSNQQIGWIAGVGATAALALAAALWLPMGITEHPGKNAKFAKTNPPVRTALTLRKDNNGKDNIQPVANSVAGVAPPSRPVQVAQAAPQALNFSNPGPFAAPASPAPVGAHKPLPMALPLRTLPPIPAPFIASKTSATAKPTLMASRFDSIQYDNDRVLSGRALLSPTPSTMPPASSVSGVDQPAPPPTTTFKAGFPAADSLGPAMAANKIAAVPQGQATAGTAHSLPTPSEPRDKPQLPAFAPSSSAGNTRHRAAARKAVVPPANSRIFSIINNNGDASGGQSLETWQSALAAAVQPPLWGEDTGAAQANQALMAIRDGGLLDTLRSRLEARREQLPQDIGTGRMLAAIYDFAFQNDLVLGERRRIVGLAGAVGEDWFALAQAEERAGNAQAARTAYRRALEAPMPPNSFHAALARQRASP